MYMRVCLCVDGVVNRFTLNTAAAAAALRDIDTYMNTYRGQRPCNTDVYIYIHTCIHAYTGQRPYNTDVYI